MVGQEGAPRTARIPVWAEHEVIDHQLAAAVEQVEQRLLALRRLEHVCRIDLDPRQRLALGVDGVAQMDGLFLARQQRSALDKPFVS